MTLEVKAVDTSQRVITAYAAVAGNLDRVGDIIDPGAFKTCLAEKPPTDVSVFIGHKTDDLAVGVCRAWQFDGKGLLTETKVFDGPAGDNLLANVRGMMAVGRQVGASIGYRTRKSAPERYDGKLVRRLLDIDVMEYSFADSNAVANQQALVLGVKVVGDYRIEQRDDGWHVIEPADGDDLGTYESEEAVRTAVAALEREAAEPDMMKPGGGKVVAVQDLPDRSFLFIEAGGVLDDEGKTHPRSKRLFRYRDAEGQIDVPALQEALGVIRQSHADGLPVDMLAAKARRLLADAQGEGKLTGDEPEWQDGAALAIYGIGADLMALAETLAAQYKASAVTRQDTKDQQVIQPPERVVLEAKIQALQVHADRAALVAAGADDAARQERNRRRLQFLEMVS